MCRAENELIRSHPEFKQSCDQFWSSKCPVSWSLGTYVAVLNDKESCNDIDEDDVVKTRSLLTRCAPYYLQWSNSSSSRSSTCGLEEVPLDCSQFALLINPDTCPFFRYSIESFIKQLHGIKTKEK